MHNFLVTFKPSAKDATHSAADDVKTIRTVKEEKASFDIRSEILHGADECHYTKALRRRRSLTTIEIKPGQSKSVRAKRLMTVCIPKIATVFRNPPAFPFATAASYKISRLCRTLNDLE